MGFTMFLGWRVWLSLAAPLLLTSAAMGDVTLEELLDAFERSSGTLQSFDVYLEGRRWWPLKSVVVGTRTIRGREVPITEKRELRPGEKPEVEHRCSRQVLSPDGKRRVERFNPESGESEGAKVFNGEIQRKLSKKQGTGTISPPDPLFVVNGEDYLTYFRSAHAGPDLVDVFRRRKGTRLVGALNGDRDKLVIESPPEAGTLREENGWRIWLDAKHGLLPSRIDMYDESMEYLYSRTVVHEFHNVEPGVWAPIDVTITWFTPEGKEAFVVHNRVDVERSRWNQPLSDDLFTLPFPAGTRVLDRIRNVAFVAGEGDTGASVDRLIQNAGDTIRLPQLPIRSTPPSRVPWRLLVIGLNAAALMSLLGILFWRKRRRRRSPAE